MKISIVIPNYNGASLLSKNIPKLKSAVGSSAEIIVVDDASRDNSKDIIKRLGAKLIANDKNLGFSKSINKGVSLAKGDIVILLNSDVWPEDNFINNILPKFKDEEVFAVGFLDKSVEGKRIVLRGRGIGRWDKGLLIHSKGEIDDKTSTLWASGGSAAFRKTIWNKLKGFDKLYSPFYWEDIDLSYRALKSGYKIIFDKSIIVYHEHHKGAIKSNYSDFQIKTISYRNQLIFSWKNATDLSLQLSQFLFLPYHIAKAIVNKDRAFIHGFFGALIRLPEIVKSSLEAQRLFVKTDREVIREFKE
jgi:GT2 family glycosyltransferase